MFEKGRLEFTEEFEVNLPKEIIHDFMLRSWNITLNEYESPRKINIQEGKNELIWNFDTGRGINHEKILFKRSADGPTKIMLHADLPDIGLLSLGKNQEHNGEAFIVSNKLLFKSLEHIYRNDLSNTVSNTETSKDKKPFYMKEYSSTVLDIDILATYNFLKKRYQLFNEIKKGYPTFKGENKSILLDEKGKCLKIRSKCRLGDLQTYYYFHKGNAFREVDIRFRVPYWHLLAKTNRMSFRYTFRALRTIIRAFDHVYKKHMS